MPVPLHFPPEQVLAFRLERQYLNARLPRGSLLDAAAAGPVQNTPPGSAGLSLLARVEGVTQTDVETALERDKTLLQAWSLRGAPHIFPAAQRAVFTQGLLPETEADIRAYIYGVVPALEQIGIGAVEVVDRAAHSLLEVLDGRAMTKDALGVELARQVGEHLTAAQQGSWKVDSWYARGQSLGESVMRFVLPVLALRGLCCHAERRGGQAFLRRTDQWLDLPGAEMPGEGTDRAAAGLLTGYLRCYGPSSAADFAAWAGIGVEQAGRAWQQVQDQLLEVEVGGRTAWLLEEDAEAFRSAAHAGKAHLLPPHDPFLQLRDRDTLVPDQSARRQLWRAVGSPGMVLAQGRAAGAWRPEKQGTRLKIIVQPLGEIDIPGRAAIEAEAERMMVFRACSTLQVLYKPF